MLLKKLEEKAVRYEEVNELVQDPDLIKDQKRYKDVMREHFGFTENFALNLSKHIPSQAGLAGGSSDAAATMHLIKEMLHLETDDETMIQLAKKVGADVPFCYILQSPRLRSDR